jgi:hypothetical protein
MVIACHGLVESVETPQDESPVARAVEVLTQRLLDDRALGEPTGGAVFAESVTKRNRQTRADPDAPDFRGDHGEDSDALS